jgi:hypothetical protein
MEGEEGGGVRLSKRFNDDKGGGEVDYKTKSGTAWSHNFLNQKPWHPLSYPNQRRKWIAEQTHAQRERKTEEVAREASSFPAYYSLSISLNLILMSITILHNPLIVFCSMLRSKSFIARQLLSPRRTRKRFGFAPYPFLVTSFLVCWLQYGFLYLCFVCLCVCRWSLCKLLALCMFVLLVTILKVLRLQS